MRNNLILKNILRSEKNSFIIMAKDYFKELDSGFYIKKDFKKNYLESIFKHKNHFIKYIIVNKKPIGFVKFGIENHYYQKIKVGHIFDLYIKREFRKKKIAKEVLMIIFKKLKKSNVKKIKIEILKNNKKAKIFWKKIGFLHITEVFQLNYE